MTNILSRFWQELKRRNVVRVIIVYAGAAFVILELVDILAPSLGLPGWTLNMVLVLLIVGFIIAILLAWVYDIHPDGGIVRTKPAGKTIPEDLPGSYNSWKIASYISFVVIVILIVLNIIPRSGKKEILEKSIAVLPFHNDSPDQEMYFINGVMEEILGNLCKIEDLRVVSRNSVEQYREHPKPIPVVAEEMDVSYVLEGSGQRDGNNIRLTVQLLDARKDKHIWSESYYREINNIFELQSEISQLVAREIEVMITPDEKQLIEKVPTKNQTAWELYIRAREIHRSDFQKAEELYRLSLEYDSTFSLPYNFLGWIYWAKYQNTAQVQAEYLDSILKFVNRALYFDDQDAEAYNLRGYYHRLIGKEDKAIEDFKQTLELNPNFLGAITGKAWIAWDKSDMLGAIENFHKAISIDRGPSLPTNYRNLSHAYMMSGFKERSDYYSLKALELDGDSAQYYCDLARNEWVLNDPCKARELLERGHDLDSTNTDILIRLGLYQQVNEQHEKSLVYIQKYVDRLGDPGRIPVYYKNAVAYAYLMNGLNEIAEEYFSQQVDYAEEILSSGQLHKDLLKAVAEIKALQGEKEQALNYLKKWNQLPRMTVEQSKTSTSKWAFFDDFKDDPEFRQIFTDFDTKYHAEYERVRRWLEENYASEFNPNSTR